MNKTKMYFKPDDTNCYPLEYHMEFMKEQGINEMVVHLAKPEVIKGFFWCKALSSAGETGDCGPLCSLYSPKNGRNGRCSEWSNFHAPTASEIKLRL